MSYFKQVGENGMDVYPCKVFLKVCFLFLSKIYICADVDCTGKAEVALGILQRPDSAKNLLLFPNTSLIFIYTEHTKS